MFVITKLRLMRNQFYNPIIRPVFSRRKRPLIDIAGRLWYNNATGKLKSITQVYPSNDTNLLNPLYLKKEVDF